MTSEARDLLITLMAQEMYSLLRDAETLAGGVLSSQTPYLLKLLAFEIGLKCCCVMEGLEPQASHDYRQIFATLPARVQTELRQAAAARMGPHADWTDFEGLLTLWSKNFIRLRYPYEAYAGLTETEFKRKRSGMAYCHRHPIMISRDPPSISSKRAARACRPA